MSREMGGHNLVTQNGKWATQHLDEFPGGRYLENTTELALPLKLLFWGREDKKPKKELVVLFL